MSYSELAGENRVDSTCHGKLTTLSGKLVNHTLRKEIRRCRLSPHLIEVGTETLEQKFKIALELEKTALLRLNPPGFLRRSADDQTETSVLFITFKSLAIFIGKLLIDISVFEELKRADLTIAVVGNYLESTRNKRLPEHIEILTQRIDYLHAMVRRKSTESGIIVGLGQRIIHRFDEAVCSQKVGYSISHRLRIRTGSCIDRHSHITGKLDIVVSVDSENLLYDVALPINIHHIGRSKNRSRSIPLFDKLVA